MLLGCGSSLFALRFIDKGTQYLQQDQQKVSRHLFSEHAI